MNTLAITTFAHTSSDRVRHITGRDPRAARLFARAHRNPHPNRFQKLLARPMQPLLQLDTIVRQRDLTNRYHDGTQAIPVQDIHGTLNRAEDFDYDFRPLKEADQDRWSGVASAMMSGVGLPPIEVVQVGDAYFVKDGHHRVSVARALGFRYLDAVVEVWAEA